MTVVNPEPNTPNDSPGATFVVLGPEDTANMTIKEYEKFITESALPKLNAVDPNWFADVDLDRLDMGSPTDCVLGQLADHVVKGLQTLYGDKAPYLHNTPFGSIEPYGDEKRDGIDTLAWKHIIKMMRRNAEKEATTRRIEAERQAKAAARQAAKDAKNVPQPATATA